MSAGTDPVVPVPARRVRTVRNWKRIVIGIAVAAVGLVVLIAGALLQVGTLGAQVLRPTARADMGEPIAFEAEAKRYDLVAVRADTQRADRVDEVAGRTSCAITLADGTTATVRGDRQAVSTSSSIGATIGWFDAVAGPTTVVCDHERADGIFIGGYTVAESHRRLAAVALGLIIAGVVLGLLATALILTGARGKAVMVDT